MAVIDLKGYEHLSRELFVWLVCRPSPNTDSIFSRQVAQIDILAGASQRAQQGGGGDFFGDRDSSPTFSILQKR